MQQPILLKQRLLGSLGVLGPFAPTLRPQGYLDRIFVPRWYVDPGLAGGLNDGSSWPNAFNNATTAWDDAIAASSAGDDFYANAASNCSNAAGKLYTFKGTAAAPNRIFSCTGITNNPPQEADIGLGAQITTTGNNNLTIRGYIYARGVIFNGGSGANAAGINLANTLSEQIFENCQIKCLSTGNTSGINACGSAGKVVLINTPVFLNGATSSYISISDGTFIWLDTPNAVAGTQTAIANLFLLQSGQAGMVLCSNVDFIGGTGIASGKALTTASAAAIYVQFADCKINAGVLIPRTTSPHCIIDQITSDSGATNYKQQRDAYQGTSTADTARYNNASDGTTPISVQVITTANAKPASPFECIGISRKVLAGTYANSKIFFTSAVPLLKTNDIWVDVKFLGPNYALGSAATSFGAGSGLGTLPQIPQGTKPDTIPTASSPWATGSLGYDYQLAIPSFTTAVDGEAMFFVKVGRPSLTANIDPNPTVAP